MSNDFHSSVSPHSHEKRWRIDTVFWILPFPWWAVSRPKHFMLHIHIK